jgi:histidinol-phosphate aminotransferase
MFTARYQHLDAIQRHRIVMPDNTRMRLNRLEKPEPWRTELQIAIAQALPYGRLQQYPDYPKFYERLAQFLRVETEDIVIGAGIEEFIRTLFMLCVEPGDKIAILHPTCAMFEIYGKVFGANLIKIEMNPNKPKSSWELINELPNDINLLILPNPGQPVENHFNLEELAEIASACFARDAVLAIDEAYHGFGAVSALETDLHMQFSNVVILRTFSKALGAASIRLGCAIAGPRIRNALDAVRQSGEVSSFSMCAATVLMDNYDGIVSRGIAEIANTRNWLRESIKSYFNYKAWGSYANHVLIEFPSPAVANGLKLRLGIQGVLIKGEFPPPLDRCLLVTVGGYDLMNTFFQRMKDEL